MKIDYLNRQIIIHERLDEIDAIEKELKEEGLTKEEKDQLKVLRAEQQRLKKELENLETITPTL